MKLATKTMRHMLRELRAMTPPLLPVVVRRRKLQTMVGHCLLKKRRGRPAYFTISLDSQIPAKHLPEVLVHEWAHALSWQLGPYNVDDHGPDWGIAYARLYQLVIDSENE